MEQFDAAEWWRAGVGGAGQGRIGEGAFERKDDERGEREGPNGRDADPNAGVVGDHRGQVVVPTRAVLLTG